MTFYDISMKMLIANFRRYRLYFLCNVFSVALFYSFAAIFANKSFMDKRIVDSAISGNIYAPSIFVGIFVVLFVPYANNAFLRNRKYEYGILMTLGMSETEVLTNMLIENCIIAGVSLISGLSLGTIISFAFYFIIQHVIGISALGWYFNVDSYKWTAILYGITILLTLVTCILGFTKMQLIDFMKERFKAEKRGKSLPGIFMAGVVFVAVSVLIMVIGIGNGTAVIWLVSLVIMFIGLYMIITQVESVEQFFAKIFPYYMKRHFIEISFVKQHHKSQSRIGIIAAGLIGFCVLFGGLSVVMYPGLLDNAITYSPYDLVYSQTFGMNKVEDREIESLLNQNDVSVKTIKQVDYLRGRAFNLLPVSEVNKEFDCNYQVSEGKFRMVFQYALKDGYEHEMTSPKTVSFNCSDEDIELQSAGSDVRILFNRNPTFADYTLVLSDADYRKIASECKEYWTGIAKLYSFDDWKASVKGISAVQKYLLDKNQVGQSEQKYYKASSRIEAYSTSKQGAELFIFLMLFIVVLFFGASDVMIHFKIKAESEEEQRMLTGLYRIGVTAEEMLGMIRYKNVYYFL
ncbi:MAG TPA: ABC transporter permease [Ruminiclostridium sp.]